jgi:superfamily II DNA or RNA helicase
MKHKLRDYQAEDVDAVFEEWKLVRSTLGVAATGMGKTRIMVEVVERRLPGRAILLAHRSELITQANNAFRRAGIETDIEKAELTASTGLFNRAPVVLATVQTLSSGDADNKRMQRFNPMDFDTLLYDESHHSVSPSNKRIVDYFMQGNPNLKVLGVTATPDRADEEALGQIFETVAFERDIMFGVENGWLIEPQQMIVHLGNLDFSHMRTTAGDLNGSDLAKVMESESAITGVNQPVLESMHGVPQNFLTDKPVDEWSRLLRENCRTAGPRRTIIFTVSVMQAEQLCNIMNRAVPGIASWVSGKTPPYERQKIFSQFDSGMKHVLINCGVTTEGYDNPAVEIIAVARPTKSRSLYAQMVGRGTRALAGVVDGLENKEQRLKAIAESLKPSMLVMDFVGNAGKHKLINTADILGGKYSELAMEIAKKKADLTKGPVNMRQLMEEEQQKIMEAAERRRIAEESRKSKLVARVKYVTTKVSPFDAFDIVPIKPKGWDAGKQLSLAQREMLVRNGINPQELTYTEGRQLIQEMFHRWKNKLCTLKQARLLKKHGYETKNITMNDASKLIDALAKNGWKRPDFNGVAENK